MSQKNFYENLKNQLLDHHAKTRLVCLLDYRIVQNIMNDQDGKAFIFMGEGTHKIKRKAEQQACALAIQDIEAYSK